MPSVKTSVRSVLTLLALAGCLATVLPPRIALADSLPGLTIFGGLDRKYRLPYRLDFGGRPDGWDRYRLKIPKDKLKIAVAQIVVAYPADFDGKFDLKDIEVRVKGQKITVDEVIWDKENHALQIYPQESIAAGNDIEVILSNVKNPRFGIYYFTASILSPGEVPLPRYIGTWDLTISN